MTLEKLNQTWHYVEKWAKARPNAEALVFGDEKLTWREFTGQMDAVARAYLEIGIEKGDRVALLSMARNEFLTTYMAAGKVGAIWLGLSPKYTLDELRYQISDCRPKLLITLREYMGNDLAETVGALQKEFSFLKKILVVGDPFEGADGFAAYVGKPRPDFDAALAQRATRVKDTDDALLLYTTGDTFTSPEDSPKCLKAAGRTSIRVKWKKSSKRMPPSPAASAGQRQSEQTGAER
jgi:acyl-CoA synthetase (AMP-forming)/AMP-acid ligase II